MFEKELTLLEAGEMDQWESAYEQINALGHKLVDVQTNEVITEFLLHIRGSEAWVRY